jgi:hypothetical protein
MGARFFESLPVLNYEAENNIKPVSYSDTNTEESYQAAKARPLAGNAGDNVPRSFQHADIPNENPTTPTTRRLGSPIIFTDEDVRKQLSPRTHKTVFTTLIRLRSKDIQLRSENAQREQFNSYLDNTKLNLMRRLWISRINLAGPPPYNPKPGDHLKNGQGHGRSPPRQPTLPIVEDIATAPIDPAVARGLIENDTTNKETTSSAEMRSRTLPTLRKPKGRIEHHVAERRFLEQARTYNSKTPNDKANEAQDDTTDEPELFFRPRGRIEQYIANQKRLLEASIWNEETKAVRLEAKMKVLRRELEEVQERYDKVIELMDG